MASNEGEKSPRTLQVEARRQRMREINPPLKRVRVVAASDDLRRALKHPSGIKFPSSGASVEWPLDQFTRRRIREGAVTVEEAEAREDTSNQRERGQRRPPAPEREPASA